MNQRSSVFFISAIFLVGINAKLHIKNGTINLDKEKIIGGEEVDIKRYPFQVAVLLAGAFLTCSGSIITSHHILTSAHCFEKLSNPKFWAVRSGSSYKNQGGMLSEISRIITHENFIHINSDPEYGANDIAILVLSKPLTYDDNTREIPLISRDVQKGEEAYVSGWGRTQQHSEGSEKLRALRLWIDDEASCKYWDLSEKKLCGRTGHHTGACHGDSGGPLIIQGQLAGIVTGSPSDECGNPDEPMIFTSVLHHKSWIEKNTKNHTSVL